MATQSPNPTAIGDSPQTNPPDQADEQRKFKTDVSETDKEGTTVREADVRESDLSEPQSPESGTTDLGDDVRRSGRLANDRLSGPLQGPRAAGIAMARFTTNKGDPATDAGVHLTADQTRDAMQRTLYHRVCAALMMAVVALCVGCKPAGKAGGVANADSAASSSPSGASQ